MERSILLQVFRQIFAVLLVAALPAATYAAGHEANPIPADFSIRLSRGGCEGACPIYTIAVDHASVVRWKGEQFVRRRGSAVKRVDPQALRSIVSAARAQRMLELKPGKYPCIDSPLTELTLTLDRRSLYVAYCTGDPRAESRRVLAFAAFVDEALADQAWVGGPEDRRMR